jgi:Flp pilus assembly protein TadG
MHVRRRRGERGHSVLEGGLILLLFLGFLIGTLDFAQVLFFHQSLVERAREAARYGALHPDDAGGAKNVAVYNTAAPSDGAPAILPGLTTAMVTVTPAGTGTPEARVKVTISGYPYYFFSPMIAGSRTASVSATMLSEAP